MQRHTSPLATASPMPPVVRWLVAPRPVGLLLAVSLAGGVAYALTMLSWPLILGHGPFWTWPKGTIPNGDNDAAQALVGYLYLQHGPWTLPLLFAPGLGAPAGTNVFWLDVVPWLSLLGKLAFTLSGHAVNLFGLFLFAGFALPGLAMTTLLIAAGQRSLIAAFAATAIAEATPFALYRFGHMALGAQYLLIFALALYVLGRRQRGKPGIAMAWAALLTLALLTQVYLTAMVAAIWAAALLQRCLDEKAAIPRVAAELVATAALLALAMALTGMLSGVSTSASAPGLGILSMNLAGPFVPQMSGLVPALRHYRVGTSGQYEGFAYLGGGVLLLLLVMLPAEIGWLRRRGLSHAALILALAACCAFALSPVVILGGHVVLRVPLPDTLTTLLSLFRSSGRFFWPAGYALAAGAILLALRRLPPAIACALLALAGVLQLIDAEPLRRAVAASAAVASPAVLDGGAAARVLDGAADVLVFPSYGCVDDDVGPGQSASPAARRLRAANMQIQLLAARRGLPINSVYNARLKPDCTAERAERQRPRRPGTAYFYLTPGGAADADCPPLGWLRACRGPA